MGWFKDRKTATKLMIGFAVAGVMMALIGVVGIRTMAELNAATDEIYIHQLSPIVLLADVQVLQQQIRAEMFAALAATSPAEVKARVERIRELSKENRARRDKLEPTIRATEVRDAFAHYLAVSKDSVEVREERLLKPLIAGRRDVAQAAVAEVTARSAASTEALATVVTLKQQHAQSTYEEAEAVYASRRTQMIVLVLVGIAVGVAFGLVVARLISRPLQATVTILDDLAQGEGDLTRRLTVDSRDEVGALATAFNTFMDKLHDIIGQSKQAAAHVATASRELAGAADQLAAGSQQQASSLEQTAASLEQITGTVKQTADNARQADQLASGTRGAADQGGQVVGQAIGAMGEINRSSKRIADIITTIDEIAFQTNLLALNAAVEAARAGEQGRGFAVVAAEVRNLAQRSALAAKEIKGLIQDSVGKVEAGSELVNKSGATLQEIVVSVKRVTDIIAEIAAASREQSIGIEQVNRAVTQMDQVVQANAAQTEEMSSTAQALAEQAGRLQELVGRFTVANGHVASVVPGRPVPVKPPTIKRADRRAPAGGRAVSVPGPEAVGPTVNGRPADGFEEF